MNLGMSLSCSQQQELRLSVTLSQVQRLTQSVSSLRDRLPQANPDLLLKKVFEDVAGAVKQPQMKHALKTLFSLEQFGIKLLGERENLAVLSPDKVRNFCLSFAYETSTDAAGSFIYSLDKDGQKPLEPPKTTKAHFIEAYLHPKQFETRIIETKTIAKQRGDISEGGLKELREMHDAQSVIEAMSEEIKSLIRLVTLAFVQSDAAGPILSNFIRDAAILGRLDLILSDDMLRRFARRCQNLINKKTAAAEFETGMLNTLGEFTLISMGIICPGIFVRQVSDLGEAYELALQELEALGIPAKKLFSYYNLRCTGRIFWYRYHLKNVPSDLIADSKVRGFLTRTFREDKAEMLTAIDYPQVFAKLKEVRLDPDTEDLGDYAEILAEALSEQDFQEKFLVLLRKWYVTFEEFL